MNKTMLLGRLTRDPELRTTASGIATCSFNLAVNREFKNKDTKEYEADFIPVVAWRQNAEFLAKYFKKGSRVLVEGNIQTRTYEKDGKKVYITEVVANRVQAVDSRQSSAPADSSSPAPSPSTSSKPTASTNGSSLVDYTNNDPIDDDELPF